MVNETPLKVHLLPEDIREKRLVTDILVIGGGLAGFFAAIKASEKNQEVTLIDKGYAGSSGGSPFAHCSAYFNPDWGDQYDEWLDKLTVNGEYINNRDWLEITLKQSYARYQDLISWGMEFKKDKKGREIREARRGNPFKTHLYQQLYVGSILRREAEKRGVRIIDRVMATELIKQDGKIVGAVGLHLFSNKIYVILAKATVMCAGAGAFRPTGYPVAELTSDADAMAYRVGAEISGKEFLDVHTTFADTPMHGDFLNDHPVTLKVLNAKGEEVKTRPGPNMSMDFEAHAGRAPTYIITPEGKFRMVGGASSGLAAHKAEGIWPADTTCATGIPGLYAAGDCLSTYQNGALYSTAGTSTVGSAVTGTIAGVSAAEYASRIGNFSQPNEGISSLKKSSIAPLLRKGGYSPAWVAQLLQNIMIPYYMMYIKRGDRMQAGLTLVEFYRDHLVPQLYAGSPHELRLAHETKNMVLNAEMRLRASLFRTESRGTHYREDYPRREDPKWLAWVILKEEDGVMKTFKRPIPKKWWPDLKKSYPELYPLRFPGE
jgi:succinate dehydrogenase/fumarate reductase flavoprotein subunit